MIKGFFKIIINSIHVSCSVAVVFIALSMYSHTWSEDRKREIRDYMYIEFFAEKFNIDFTFDQVVKWTQFERKMAGKWNQALATLKLLDPVKYKDFVLFDITLDKTDERQYRYKIVPRRK
jgi:hypothetical protein